MMDSEGMVDRMAKEPTFKMVVELHVNVYKNFPEEIGRNAWRKKCVEWFKFLFILNL